MSTFVDFVGMNTLISSSFDDSNILTSERNTELASIPVGEELVGINLHRNGPYGYSTWKQLRASENPISRHHRETNKLTFIIQPGEIRNVLSDGELRVRDRYSVLYNFTEPAICQKSYPLVWNVGRHFKDEDGNVDINNPNKFSIISSYGNQQIGFANEQANKLLKFDLDEEQTEYTAIKDMYLENGLNKQDSPLTYWEFLQYRETIFPKEQQQFVAQARTRPQFESFYRHNLNDRIKYFRTSSFGFDAAEGLGYVFALSQSSWPLDEGDDFLTVNYSADDRAIFFGNKDVTNPVTNAGRQRRGEGVLQNTLVQYNISMHTYGLNSNLNDVIAAAGNLDDRHSPSPLYARRGSINSTASVANPSGMLINHTGTGLYHLYQGSAVWEAGAKRQIKDANGNYVSSPKYPFYDTYEHYSAEMQNYGKNYVVLPEFRMSSQIEDYKRTDGGIELDMFEVTGGVSGSENSSKVNFYEIYSNSDFMKNFEIIASDHEEFTNGKVLSMRCKAIKKFLPYEGFYPCQRTVDLAQRFYDSFKDNIKLQNESGIELADFNFGKQLVMTPLFAPGLLFNTIKSGIAVDFPVMTGSLSTVSSSIFGEYIDTDLFNKRIPFEALVEPKNHLANYKLTSNEPHEDGNLRAAAVWDGHGDDLYSMMANNFLAEVPEFFLPKGQLTSVVSKKQKRIKDFEVGKIYAMRVKMRRSMNNPRISVYHSGLAHRPYTPPQDIILMDDVSSRETFTMYSRPNAFGPPTYSYVTFASTPFHFDQDGFKALGSNQIYKGSESGCNFPFTPPYYHGEGWCEMWMTASKETMTIEEIQNSITSSFSRFDDTFYRSNGVIVTSAQGAQAIVDNKINLNAVQLSASLNLFGVGSIEEGNTRAGNSLIVDTGEQEDNRWVIQTKFETPMLNFNHITGSEHLTLPFYSSGSVPRGMWHQYGRIPEENEGVFLEVGPVPANYQAVVGLGGIKRADDEPGGSPSIVLAADSGFDASALETDGTVLRFHRNNEQTTTTIAAGLKFEIDFEDDAGTLAQNDVARALDGTDDCPKITCGINGLSNITQVLAVVEDAINLAKLNGDIDDIVVSNGGATLTIINTKLGTSATDQLVISDSGNTDDQFEATGVDPAAGTPEESTSLRNGVGVAAVGIEDRLVAVKDLSEHLGFSGTGTKIGRLASAKKISEAVVAVPFILEEGRRKFFKIDPEKVRLYKEGKLEDLTQGEPNSQIGRSILLQMDKMKKFIFPPSFDFLNFDDVDPIAMYVFEFTHTLTQQDLSDIWQNLPPDIGTEMEVSEVAITHPLIRKELLGQGGESGNATIEMPDKLKWMVFKVKQRAASNYFKKTVLRNAEVNTEVQSGNVTKDEFGDTSTIQYNWPYDFFSLVEMVKIDAEVELGNIDFSNYTDNIPAWDVVMADRDKIDQVVGGLEDEPILETQAQEEVEQEANEFNLSEGMFDRGMGLGSPNQSSQPNLFTGATVGQAPDFRELERQKEQRYQNFVTSYQQKTASKTSFAEFLQPLFNSWNENYPEGGNPSEQRRAVQYATTYANSRVNNMVKEEWIRILNDLSGGAWGAYADEVL